MFENKTNRTELSSLGEFALIDQIAKSVEIKNLLGKTILTESILDRKFSNSYSIDIGSLTSGIFFLHLHSSNGDAIRKFVKQ